MNVSKSFSPPLLAHLANMDVSVPLQPCDSLATSRVLELRSHTRSSGESIGILIHWVQKGFGAC